MAPRALAWQDGRVLPAADATVPLLDPGFLLGDAVVERIPVLGGQTQALDAHLARMRSDARKLGLRLPVVTGAIRDLLVTWGEHDGVLQVLVTRGGAIRAAVEPPSRDEAVSLARVEGVWDSLADGISTPGRVAEAIATRTARQDGHADEAVLTQDGTVLEVPGASLVWVVDGALHASDPARLPIVERIGLRELAKVRPVAHGVHDLEDLLAADEVLLVAPSRRLVAVHAVEDTSFPTDGPVLAELREAFTAHLEATLDRLPR